jgi:hypothetical protein
LSRYFFFFFWSEPGTALQKKGKKILRREAWFKNPAKKKKKKKKKRKRSKNASLQHAGAVAAAGEAANCHRTMSGLLWARIYRQNDFVSSTDAHTHNKLLLVGVCSKEIMKIPTRLLLTQK